MVAPTLQAGALAEQQVLLSILVSLVLIVLIWRFDVVLDRATGISRKTLSNLRGFRVVATATTLAFAALWVATQPAPAWLADVSGAVGGPQLLGWLVAFLPAFLVRNHVPILVTLLGLWWAWKLRAEGDDLIERFVAAKYDETLAPIVENVWDVTIVAVFVLLVLDQWGISIAALLAPAGIIGIVLGFAARETVANFFGSLSLYADETYQRGDYIELESGISGTVRDISVRSTVLQTLDGDLVNVPNSELNEAKITNKSSPTTSRRIRSQIGVSYDADPEQVETILTEAAETVSETHQPRVHLREFGDSALVFDVFVWIATPDDRLQAEHDLNMAVHAALDDAGIEIPFPQREIEMEEKSPDARRADRQS
jgi:small-conductance mechanosensitive channel